MNLDVSKYQIPKFDGRTKHYNNWTLLVGGSIAIIATIVLVILALNQSQATILKIEIKDIAAVFTAIIVTTTCVYHALNLRLNLTAHSLKLQLDVDRWVHDVHQKELDIERGNAKKAEEDKKSKLLLTMEKCFEWHKMSDKTGKARAFISKNKSLLNDDNNKEFVKQIESDDNAEYRSAVICVMNYFENLSEGVDSGVLDEVYVKNIFKTMFLKYLNNLKPYFDLVEKRDGESGIYKSFRKIAERWK